MSKEKNELTIEAKNDDTIYKDIKLKLLLNLFYEKSISFNKLKEQLDEIYG